MRQGPPQSRTVVDLPVPVDARIHRMRRQKPERVILLVRGPAALPCLDPDEASVAASACFPLPGSRAYRPAYGRSGGLAFVRHDGSRFWRPLSAVGGGPVQVRDLDERIARWASGDEIWHDWPYALDKRRFGAGRLAMVPHDGLVLRSCSPDPAASHATEVRRLSESLCLIDGALHARCGEPVLDVVVQGMSKGKGTGILVVPSAGPQLDPEVEADVVQTFAGGDLGPAEAYAADLAAVTGLRLQGSAHWCVARPVLGRSDQDDAPSEGLSRIAGRTHRLVGRLPRPAAESWLDLRDAGEGTVGAAEATALARTLLGLLPPDQAALATLLRWEILRWEGALPEEDAAALGGLA